MWLSSAVLRSGTWAEVDKASLRSVLVGSSVTEVRAAKWQGHDGACPRCGEPETAMHKFWTCPATAEARRIALGEHTASALAAVLPEGTLLTGLAPRDPEVFAWAEAAEQCRELPPGKGSLNGYFSHSFEEVEIALHLFYTSYFIVS